MCLLCKLYALAMLNASCKQGDGLIRRIWRRLRSTANLQTAEAMRGFRRVSRPTWYRRYRGRGAAATASHLALMLTCCCVCVMHSR